MSAGSGVHPEGNNTAAAELTARYHRVRAAMAQATAAAGGAPDSVTLVAVSKRQPLWALTALYDLGVRDFGENYAQEMAAHAQHLAASGRRPRWHFIGALQGNKVRAITRLAHAVHTIDSLDCAQAVMRAAASGDRAAPPALLLQVRLVDDPLRPGVAESAAPALAQALLATPSVPLVGLMGVPPQGQNPAPYFARLRRLRDAIGASPGGQGVQALSMGMSEDFAMAIAEGATMVRVGSALFGPRPPATRT